jgi:predicted transcriptional regulator
MKIAELGPSKIMVALSRDELRILSNALNEVCNALDVEEFATRMGAEPSEAKSLLKQLVAANDKMEQP